MAKTKRNLLVGSGHTGRSQQANSFIIIGLLPGYTDTSSFSTLSMPDDESRVYRHQPTASRSTSLRVPESDTRKALNELRQRSGLNGQQLADLFGVSRRMVLYWASGEAMSAQNERHLNEVLDLLRLFDTGHAKQNRAWLLSPQDGSIPFELLCAKQYTELRQLLHPLHQRPRFRPAAGQILPPKSRPLAPEVLVDALQDKVHSEHGKTRVIKPVRAPKVVRDNTDA